MDYIDLTIDVTTGAIWEARNLRMQNLKNSTKVLDNNTNDNNNAASTSGSSSSCNNTSDNEFQTRMVLDLYLAAKTGDVDKLIDTLETVSTEKNLPAWDQVSPAGNTLLHACVIYGNREGAAFIAHHFPTLLARPDSRGDTVLHLVARAGDRGLVETPVERAPPEIIRNKEGNTPLHESLTEVCDEGVACYLIRSGRSVLHLLNNQRESPLYLASKAGKAGIVKEILDNDHNENQSTEGRLEGKSAVHAAIINRDQGVIETLLDREPRFIILRDEEGRTPLHLAASLGYLEEVKYLLGINSDSIFLRDNNGLLPIHLASMKGYKNLVCLLLQYWPEPCELLSSIRQNILHVAVESGSNDMVSYILGTNEFKKLINMKDEKGNTPLHIAAMSWHPKIVSTLIRDKRVDLKLVNIQAKTALDCAEHHMETVPSLRMLLTLATLRNGGVPRAYSNSIPVNKDPQSRTPPDMKTFKDKVNTLLLVATLVATITFAAGFTMPGGYNNSNRDQGMATMLNNKWFHVFVICDTIAMYSSILAVLALLWAQIEDHRSVLSALWLALPLLGVSLSMMSLSFAAAVYLVVSKLRWLAISVLVIGFVSLVILVDQLFSVSILLSSNHGVMYYVTYYPFWFLTFLIKHYY